MTCVVLDWHELSREHIQDLAGFTCADPEKPPRYELGVGKRPHPYPHELAVQNYVRGCSPRGTDLERTVQLGYDGAKLAAFVELAIQRDLDAPRGARMDSCSSLVSP